MLSVKRTRTLLPKDNKEKRLMVEDSKNWEGNKTWLHIVFNKPLFICGLALEENETFLRLLLIKRMKYYKRLLNRKPLSWYLAKKGDSKAEDDKRFFLEKVGF